MASSSTIGRLPLAAPVKKVLGRSAMRLRNLALDWGLGGGHRDYARFIILGEGRSGSNFLRGLLNSHPQIITFGELFRFADAIGWELPAYDLCLSTPRLIALSQTAPVAFLEQEVFRRFPGRTRAVGFKIFYYHADRGARAGVWSYLKDHRDIKVLHIKRWNTLRAFLSLRKAFLTDRWTEPNGPRPDALSVPLDYEECRHRFALAEEMKDRFDALFRDHPKIDVVYETLGHDHEGEMARVQALLGVDPHPTRPLTYKQAGLPLAQAISNYAELKKAFANTRWSEFFEE